MSPEQGRVEYKDIPVTVNRNIDILFVIDDSGSMADKQANLRANFPSFIDVLNTIQGGLPDVHIGVINSDMGTKPDSNEPAGPGIGSIGNGGCAQAGAGGALQTGGVTFSDGASYLSDIKNPDGTRARNYPEGQLAQTFSQMADVGDDGCGFEQHLHAMKAALNNNPANQGFVRPDAFLAVIFIADEDDCSMSKAALLQSGDALGPLQSFRCTRYGVTCDVGGATDQEMNQVGTKMQCHPNDNSQYLQKVQSYVDFLKGLKPDDPGKVIVAGIMGTIEPFAVENRSTGGAPPAPALARSCTYVGGNGMTQVADPPTRLKFFLDQFPNRSTFTTICQQNLSEGLQLIAELLKTALGNPCIEGTLADVDEQTAGAQYDCSVSFVTNQGKPNQTEQILPACNADATNKPCWRLIPDATKCPEGSNLVLDVPGSESAPPNSHIIANCVTEAL